MGSRPPGVADDAGPDREVAVAIPPPEDGAFGAAMAGADGIEVVLADPAWRSAVPRVEEAARRAALAALTEAGNDGMAVTILLTDDRDVRRLNTDHRGKAKPTNVLSFPAEHPAFPHPVDVGPVHVGPVYVGDVALALGTVRREARAAGRSVLAHLSHLVAHGVLHLVGHDHLRAGEARRMERAEARVMRRLALPNPWRGVA